MRKIGILFIVIFLLCGTAIVETAYAKSQPVNKNVSVNFKSYGGNWVDTKLKPHEDYTELGNIGYCTLSLSFVDGKKAKMNLETVHSSGAGAVLYSEIEEIVTFNSKGISTFNFQDEWGVLGKGSIQLKDKKITVTLTHTGYDPDSGYSKDHPPRFSSFKGTRTFAYKKAFKNGVSYTVTP